jgi:hypothetical protein
MMLKKVFTEIPMSAVVKTKAFQRRDKEWSFESWDATEWEECYEEAKEELSKEKA